MERAKKRKEGHACPRQVLSLESKIYSGHGVSGISGHKP